MDRHHQGSGQYDSIAYETQFQEFTNFACATCVTLRGWMLVSVGLYSLGGDVGWMHDLQLEGQGYGLVLRRLLAASRVLWPCCP